MPVQVCPISLAACRSYTALGVGGPGTTTTLSSPARPSVAGHPVTYTATVSPAPGGGTVAFTDNGSLIARCTAVPVQGGTARCATTPRTTGAHNITAAYSGTAASPRCRLRLSRNRSLYRRDAGTTR
jgi:Bacterial Ig-like domain (group 3)